MKKTEGSLQTTKTIPAFIARTQLGQILERVTKDQDRFLISRRGQVVAVIMGIEDYLTNIVKQPEVLTRLQEQAAKSRASKLTLEEIDREIASVRRKGEA